MPVLGTKLHVPAMRRRLVPRPRLTGRLQGDPASLPRLVLVSAPAGFGKTTLLAQWLASGEPAGPPPRVAWLSLDAEDSELRRFVTHLVAAIQTSSPRVGAEALALLESDRALPAEAVLVSLVNDLDELAGPTVLALDDYHVIDAPDIHEAVTFLLDHLPPQVTIAITTRADPPLPLARLRGRGELLELRAADLRFTAGEADAFLNHVMDLDLDPAHVAALEHRTEGWAAGLQLAALSARGRTDAGDSGGVASFVDAFTGSHRFVLDYLVEEVLNSQPDDVRGFLLDTSVLQQMTGTLCDALTGRDDGRQTLEILERGNLFVIPLDDQRQWYRYHHLFADALRARLLAQHPDRVPELHRAASRWHAEHGMLADAVNHAIAGDDFERAARPRRARAGRPPQAPARPHATGVVARPAGTMSSGGVLSWSRSWPGRGSPRAISMGPRCGSMRPNGHWTTFDRKQSRVSPVRWRRRPAPGTRSCGPSRPRSRPIAPPSPRPAATSTAPLRTPATYWSWPGRTTISPAEPPPASSAWPRGPPGDPVTAVDTFSTAVASLHAAGNIADELGATVPLAGMWLTRGGRRRHDGCTSGRSRSPNVIRACCPRPVTCTSVWPTCSGSRATSTRPRTTSRWPGSSVTGRRSWRTVTAGTRPWRGCCRREATSTAPCGCSTTPNGSTCPASSPMCDPSRPRGRGSASPRAASRTRGTGRTSTM